jgi:hypothetical protein
VNRNRPGRRPAESESFDGERFSLENYALAGERLAQELHRLAHTGGRVAEFAAVPGLDNRLRPGSNT